MITHARTVGIYVSDQGRALEYYTTALGWHVFQDRPMSQEPGAARWIEVAPEGAQTHCLLFTPTGQEARVGGFSNIVFTCADILATYAELVARGVTFGEAPVRQPWGWWATFSDPDGNVFGLGQDGEG